MGSVYSLVSPDDNLDWTIDLTNDLGSDDVASAIWAIDPTGPTLHTQSNAAKTATTWAGPGFVAGTDYVLKADITTAAGRVFERSITIRCEDNR